MQDNLNLPLKSIDEITEELIENLQAAQELGTEFMYQTLMDYGKQLGDYPRELMIDKYKIHGCQSIVYIYGEKKDGRLFLQGYADAKLVQGQVAILLNIFNGQKVEDILKADEQLERFVKETNIIASLTPSRQNAFGSMFEHIKNLARQ